MDLVIGGAFQGKLTWAVAQFALQQTELLDLRQAEPVPGGRCWYHLEELTWRAAGAGESAAALLDRMWACLPVAAVISREIGSGVVPLDPVERAWRELHGQVLRALANRANHVTRIFCGLPEVLK